MSSNYRLVLNIPEINQAAENAFRQTALLLSREFTKVITEPRTWLGFEDQRDIVDTGRLRSSQQMVFIGSLTCIFSWPTEYAAPVHDGYTLRNGRRVEGRPWTDIARQQLDVAAAFASFYQQELSK